MSYNPYDLVEMRINGVTIYGRPIEFDAEIADFNKLVDAFGNLIHPKRLSTTCPSCGQGLIVDACLPDPPFPIIERSCPYCRPNAPPPQDPFNNPLESGKILPHELDPLLHDLNRQLDFQEKTVAERLPITNLAEITQESPSFDFPAVPIEDTNADLIEVLQRNEEQKKKPKKPKKTTKKPLEVEEPIHEIEQHVEESPIAQSIKETESIEETEEQSFDDSDLIEPQ